MKTLHKPTKTKFRRDPPPSETWFFSVYLIKLYWNIKILMDFERFTDEARKQAQNINFWYYSWCFWQASISMAFDMSQNGIKTISLHVLRKCLEQLSKTLCFTVFTNCNIQENAWKSCQKPCVLRWWNSETAFPFESGDETCQENPGLTKGPGGIYVVGYIAINPF